MCRVVKKLVTGGNVFHFIIRYYLLKEVEERREPSLDKTHDTKNSVFTDY